MNVICELIFDLKAKSCTTHARKTGPWKVTTPIRIGTVKISQLGSYAQKLSILETTKALTLNRMPYFWKFSMMSLKFATTTTIIVRLKNPGKELL